MQPALAHEATPLWGLTCALFISHLQLPVCGAPSWPGSDSPNRPDPGHGWSLGSTDEQSRHGQNTELDCRDGWVLAGDRHLHFAPACPCHWVVERYHRRRLCHRSWRLGCSYIAARQWVTG